jgi:hypothetical protein
MMITRLLLCVLVGSGLISAGAKNAVFWDKDLRWQQGPPDLNYEVAFGTLTVFRGSGQIVQLSCELMRDAPNGPVMFNLKSGYAVFAGSWSRASGHEIVVYRHLVAREKLAVPIGQRDTLPGPQIREVWRLRGGDTPASASSITAEAAELVPVPSLQNPDELGKVIRRYSKRSARK